LPVADVRNIRIAVRIHDAVRAETAEKQGANVKIDFSAILLALGKTYCLFLQQ
jgi:hypothetical protein